MHRQAERELYLGIIRLFPGTLQRFSVFTEASKFSIMKGVKAT